MEFWHAAVLGLVEGLTEFIPVSSTGHLILASSLLSLPSGGFLKTFEIAIQTGALAAIVLLYGRKFLVDRGVFWRVSAAFVPTVVVGVLVHKQAKALLGNPKLVLVTLVLGGAVLIVLEMLHNESKTRVKNLPSVSFGQAAVIGLCQTFAFVPGVSRSGATIAGALGAGLNRKTAMEFSFLLAAPTLLAATGFDLIENAGGFTAREWGLLAVGLVVAFVSAWATVKAVVGFVDRFGFRPFGIYRIVLAAVLWAFMR